LDHVHPEELLQLTPKPSYIQFHNIYKYNAMRTKMVGFLLSLFLIAACQQKTAPAVAAEPITVQTTTKTVKVENYG
jgi:uncharacterized lipoprotein YajG